MRVVKQTPKGAHRAQAARGERGETPTNRTRIVEAALALFDVRGVRDVTTNHIADHLGISPGNLYYHFRNKEEIVRAIFPAIDAAVREAIALPFDREITAELLGAYYLAGLERLFTYRFFFADAGYLIARDPLLARDYGVLHDWLIATFIELFSCLRREGHLDPRAGDDDLRRLAVNAFLVWFWWLPYVRMVDPEVAIDRTVAARGALQSFLVLAPHLEPRFRARARRVLDQGARPRRRGGMVA